jgi:hypothetical protein
MRAALRIDAPLSQPQPLDGPSAHQVLFHNRRRIRGLHVSVPHGLGINHHRRPVLALVQAEGFVDAHRGAQTGRLRQLLQLCVEIAFSIGSARWPGRIGRAGVVADKNMAFKCGQAVFLS